MNGRRIYRVMHELEAPHKHHRRHRFAAAAAVAFAIAVVSLTVAGAAGATETSPEPPIHAALRTSSITMPDTTLLGSGNVDEDPRGLRFEYDFDGDGVYDKSDEGEFAEHRYTVAGTYVARVRVSDRFGHSDTATATVVITAAQAAHAAQSLAAPPKEGASLGGSVGRTLISAAIGLALLAAITIALIAGRARAGTGPSVAAGPSSLYSPRAARRAANPGPRTGYTVNGPNPYGPPTIISELRARDTRPWAFQFPWASAAVAALFYPAVHAASTAVGNSGWNHPTGFWGSTPIADLGFGIGLLIVPGATLFFIALIIVSDFTSPARTPGTAGATARRVIMWAAVSIASVAAALGVAVFAGFIISALTSQGV